MSANSRTAVVSIALTALALVLAAQGAGFVVGFVRRLSGGPVWGASLAAAIAPFSFIAMVAAALIAGTWLRARHAKAAGVAFLAALATGALNGTLNHFAGGPHFDILKAAPAHPEVLIGATIAILAFVLIIWAVLLLGGLFAGRFRSRDPA